MGRNRVQEITDAYIKAIEGGMLRPGGQIPTVGEMVAMHQVSSSSLAKVRQYLYRHGYTEEGPGGKPIVSTDWKRVR